MEQACILLEGGVTDEGNCGLVGYGDVYAFSKQFSRSLDSTWKVPRTSSHGCAGFRTVFKISSTFYVSACPVDGTVADSIDSTRSSFSGMDEGFTDSFHHHGYP